MSLLACAARVAERATRQRFAVPDRRIPAMFRRSALPAAASLAVVLLAVTGCKIQVSDAAPGGTSTAGAEKVVEADYGTKHGKTFVGSENFSSTSLNQNRELGLIISGHAVMSAIAGTFAADFRNGKHWSSA
jgi:phosphatidylserine/phosphatidylglycerophosphate/cardiolipin synthase-like enzyme